MKTRLLFAIAAVLTGTTALTARQTQPLRNGNLVVETTNDFNNPHYSNGGNNVLSTSMVYDNAGAATLLVYPNPTHSNARVVLPQPSVATVYVDVVSLNGNVARSYQYPPGSYLLDVDLSTLPSSMYSVRVYGNSVGFYNIRVLKH
jgi:hypothetical protein